MHALSTNTILHKFIFVYIPLNSNMSWYEESVMASNVGSPHMSPARRLRIVVGGGEAVIVIGLFVFLNQSESCLAATIVFRSRI